VAAVQPEAELGPLFDDAGGRGKRRVGQVAISYDADESAAAKRAGEQFRWFAGGWDVMAELPGTSHFAAASQNVREEDITTQIPCGPGGDTQSAFFDWVDWAERELLPELRRLP
jgi:hypothetical protein